MSEWIPGGPGGWDMLVDWSCRMATDGSFDMFWPKKGSFAQAIIRAAAASPSKPLVIYTSSMAGATEVIDITTAQRCPKNMLRKVLLNQMLVAFCALGQVPAALNWPVR